MAHERTLPLSTEAGEAFVFRPMEDHDIDSLWGELARVRSLSFIAESDSATGWRGAGIGTVAAQSLTADILIFTETGIWRTVAGRELGFRNTYRWTRLAQSLRLEHLRFGETDPVYLFDLTPGANDDFVSATPHVCHADIYSARLRRDNGAIHLDWTVSGAEKSERIAYIYS